MLNPSVSKSKIPYAFIASANPVIFDLSEEYPLMGSNAGIKEQDKIQEFRKAFAPHQQKFLSYVKEIYSKIGVEIDPNQIIDKPVSKYFNIYSFPKEIDYYSDAVKKSIFETI